MSFSIEALQSKAKLRQTRNQEFARKVLWPELMQREADTIIESATYKMKSVVQSVLTKIRSIVKPQTDAIVSVNANEEDLETIVDISEDTNSEGFLEVVITKDNLPSTSKTKDED